MGISLTGRLGALTGLQYSDPGKLHWVLNGALNPDNGTSAELIIKGTKEDGTFGECPHKKVECLGNLRTPSTVNSRSWQPGTSCQDILDSFRGALYGPSGGLAWCAHIDNNGTIQPGYQRGEPPHTNDGGCYLGITDITNA